MNHAIRRGLILASTIAALGIPRGAMATLGGDASTVDADRIHVQGALVRSVRSDAASVQEIQSAGGVTIREYVSASGTVFAVAWQGAWLPDLQQLLGAYYQRFQQSAGSAQQARRGRRPLAVRDADLVVQTGGHQRAFSGRAYLPGLLPQGFAVQSIQ